jgi:hypothetical protein
MSLPEKSFPSPMLTKPSGLDQSHILLRERNLDASSLESAPNAEVDVGT